MHALQTLKNEHTRIRSILSRFEKQLNLFERAEQPDYEILESSIYYCQQYLNRWHHPNEELLLDLVRARDPDKARTCEELREQHGALARSARRVVKVFEAVERDVPFQRSTLVQRGRNLLHAYRSHLDWEEMNCFPVIEQTLIAADWREAEICFATRIDPLTAYPVDQVDQILFNGMNQLRDYQE